MSVPNSKTAPSLLCELNFVTVDSSHTSIGNPSELYRLARICFVCLISSFAGACPIFMAGTKHKLSLLSSTAMH